MSENIIRSFNLFCDTDRGAETPSGKGDNFELLLNGVNVSCDRGQVIRLSLKSFIMQKNFPNINRNNSRFTIKTNGTHFNNDVNLTHQNVKSIHDLAEDFGEKLSEALLAMATTNHGSTATTATATQVLPQGATNAAGTTDDIIQFKVVFDADHNINDLKIQAFERYGNQLSDIYSILGINRIRKDSDDTDFTSNSLGVGDVTITAREITIKCKYPGQRQSEHSVYLRTSLNSNNLATSSLNDARTPGIHNNKVTHTDILGRFNIDNEFIAWESSTGREFFLELREKHLANATFYLTDSHGQPLDYYSGQAANGNLNFAFTLRIDILQKSAPNERFTEDPKSTIPGYWENPHIKYTGHNRI